MFESFQTLNSAQIVEATVTLADLASILWSPEPEQKETIQFASWHSVERALTESNGRPIISYKQTAYTVAPPLVDKHSIVFGSVQISQVFCSKASINKSRLGLQRGFEVSSIFCSEGETTWRSIGTYGRLHCQWPWIIWKRGRVWLLARCKVYIGTRILTSLLHTSCYATCIWLVTFQWSTVTKQLPTKPGFHSWIGNGMPYVYYWTTNAHAAPRHSLSRLLPNASALRP